MRKNMIKIVGWFCIPALLAAGCASETAKPLAERGWIGGEYVAARPSTLWNRWSGEGVACTLPEALQTNRSVAVQITRLNTNSPVALAGLRKDDFILEVNHRPVSGLEAFRRTVDRSQPGTTLAVTAWQDRKLVEYSVLVGREKYKSGGNLYVGLPTVVHRWDLWPDPGFSLVCVGYEPNPGLRHELASRAKPQEVYNEDWKAYLGFIEVSKGEWVTAEEPVTDSAPTK
jgi:hypothetical protein